MTPPEMHALLLETIQEFFTHAGDKKRDIVPMPINYLLKKLGFTGVISSINDRFNRGLIALELEDTTHLAFIPVKPLTYDPSSPQKAIRTSPWGGPLTPTSPSPTVSTRSRRSSSTSSLGLFSNQSFSSSDSNFSLCKDSSPSFS